MIGKKNKDESTPAGSAINVIGEGTRLDGSISSSGDLRIDGKVEGDVQTSGKCVLGASGNIIGNIHANNADISGFVEGNITIQDLLLIKSSGIVNGDIRTVKIIVESGGSFNGACTMGKETPESREDKRKPLEQ